MTREVEWEDEEEEGVEEEEGDSDADLLTCPTCRGKVHEETQQCPHCGDWIMPVDESGAIKRVVWIAAAILGIVAMVVATVM